MSVVAVDRISRSVRGCDVSEHRGRRRGYEGRVVVLAGREGVEADLFCLQGDGDNRLDPPASDGVRPVVGSVVTSPTLKIPNCIALPLRPWAPYPLTVQLPGQR